MNKIKSFFKFLISLFVNPIKAIASINLSERFISFASKHIWFRLLLALIIASVMYYLVYYTQLFN